MRIIWKTKNIKIKQKENNIKIHECNWINCDRKEFMRNNYKNINNAWKYLNKRWILSDWLHNVNSIDHKAEWNNNNNKNNIENNRIIRIFDCDERTFGVRKSIHLIFDCMPQFWNTITTCTQTKIKCLKWVIEIYSKNIVLYKSEKVNRLWNRNQVEVFTFRERVICCCCWMCVSRIYAVLAEKKQHTIIVARAKLTIVCILKLSICLHSNNDEMKCWTFPKHHHNTNRNTEIIKTYSEQQSSPQLAQNNTRCPILDE